jgi:hypothetical protein
MSIFKRAFPLALMLLATTALPAKADPQFCMYENPEKPKENLRYRGNFRSSYPATAPGCTIVSSGMPKPGGTAKISWPDGVTTEIVMKTLGKVRFGKLGGTATVDGEIADMEAVEEYCFVIRENRKKICY